MDTHLKELPVYKASHATLKHNCAASRKGRKNKAASNKSFEEYIHRKIVKEKFSPDAALANMRKKKFSFSVNISTKTLYNYIHKGLI
ncbi:MAG: hypothetical protein LBD73_02900, partial [Deferribacteraceae bacterium]|nr:hypothetical protein [Deferribacteraceae bacterium]